MKPSVDYHDDLLHHLKNPRYAVGYLNACLEDHDEGVFLLALRTWRRQFKNPRIRSV